MNGRRVRLAVLGGVVGAAIALVALQSSEISGASDGSPGALDGLPGAVDGSPGEIPGQSPPGVSGGSSPGDGGGSSSGPDTAVSSDEVVSVTNTNEPPYEWTLERMLMATPMPMTQEERDFLSRHPNLDQIRQWMRPQFSKYIDSDLGKKRVAEEASRWRDLANMLIKEEKIGSNLLKKPSSVKPSGTAGGSKVLQIASIEEILKMLNDGKQQDEVFAQMKLWREQIATTAKIVEPMRQEIESKGLQSAFENALNEGER